MFYTLLFFYIFRINLRVQWRWNILILLVSLINYGYLGMFWDWTDGLEFKKMYSVEKDKK